MFVQRPREFVQSRPAISLVVLLGCGTALILAVFFLTRRSKSRLYSPVRDAVRALERGDVDAVMVTLSSAAYRGNLSRQALRHLAQRVVDGYGPLRLLLIRRTCRREDSVGECEVHVVAFPFGGGGKAVRSQWIVSLERETDGWRITDLDPVSIDGRQVAGLQALPATLR